MTHYKTPDRDPSVSGKKIPDRGFPSKENKGFSAAFQPQPGPTKRIRLPMGEGQL
jgi:hypothetical protein